ncbi:MAG: hypothetical protein AAF802_09300 [Planctomycetota bacterium]
MSTSNSCETMGRRAAKRTQHHGNEAPSHDVAADIKRDLKNIARLRYSVAEWPPVKLMASDTNATHDQRT